MPLGENQILQVSLHHKTDMNMHMHGINKCLKLLITGGKSTVIKQISGSCCIGQLPVIVRNTKTKGRDKNLTNRRVCLSSNFQSPDQSLLLLWV